MTTSGRGDGVREGRAVSTVVGARRYERKGRRRGQVAGGGQASRLDSRAGPSRGHGHGGAVSRTAESGDGAGSGGAIGIELADDRDVFVGTVEVGDGLQETVAEEGKEIVAHAGIGGGGRGELLLESGQERRLDGDHVVAVIRP